MKIAFSFCPNDTFAFDAWVHKKIKSPLCIEPILADIQQLNRWACEKKYPVTKVSLFCLGKITQDYSLLHSGAAIGYNNGPKLITKNHFDLSTLSSKIVAVPGRDTTAYLLLCALLPKPKKVLFVPYNEIVSHIESGICDAGIIIHETRFTFKELGLEELVDLGELFSTTFSSPLPLGVVVAKRTLKEKMLGSVSYAIKNSIQFARKFPASSKEYVLKWSQEKNPQVIQNHIHLYVTDETEEISKKGLQAIKTLFEIAIDQKLLPKSSCNFQ